MHDSQETAVIRALMDAYRAPDRVEALLVSEVVARSGVALAEVMQVLQGLVASGVVALGPNHHRAAVEGEDPLAVKWMVMHVDESLNV